MLADIILNIVYSFSNFVVGLIPDVSLSDNIAGAVATASGYISAMNVIAPMTTLITIIGLFTTIEGAILLIKIINWFIRKIPSIN